MIDEFSSEEVIADLNEKCNRMNIYFLPNFFEFAVKDQEKIKDIKKACDNFELIFAQAKDAKSKGFYLEYISLLSSYIEYFLRMYIFAKKIHKNPFTVRYELGKLLKLMKNGDKNFEKTELYENLDDFRKFRNNNIHNLLFGFYDYDDIKIKIEDFNSLGKKTHRFVVQAIGVPYEEKKFKEHIGDLIVVLKKY